MRRDTIAKQRKKKRKRHNNAITHKDGRLHYQYSDLSVKPGDQVEWTFDGDSFAVHFDGISPLTKISDGAGPGEGS